MAFTGDIVCSNHFSKNFAGLAYPDKNRVYDAIRKLLENPLQPSLQSHRLRK